MIAQGLDTPKDTPARQPVGGCLPVYSFVMAEEDTVLEEAMDNLREAGQCIRVTQSLMRSEGMSDGENYRDLLLRAFLRGSP